MSLTRCLFVTGLTAFLCLPTVTAGQGSAPKKTPTLVDAAGDPLPAGAVARLGTARFRHPAPVTFAGYSGDGSLLVTATADSVHVWTARTGKEAHRLEIKAGARRSPFGPGPLVLLSGDGKTLVAGITDGECSVIDVASGKTLRDFHVGLSNQNRFGDGRAPQGQLSHDGRHLLIVKNDPNGVGRLAVWDTTTGKPLRDPNVKEQNTSFAAAALSRDGKTVVGIEGYSDGRKEEKNGASKPKLRFIDVASGQEIRAMESPFTSATELAFVDGKFLVTRNQNGTDVRVYDAQSGKEKHKFQAQLGPVQGFAVAPDQQSVFVGDFKQVVQFDLKSGKELKSMPISTPPPDDDNFGPFNRSARFSLAITPDGKTLAAPSQAAVEFFDVQTGKEIDVAFGHRNRIDSVAFGPGARQALSGSSDNTLYLWNLATGKAVRPFAPKADIAKEDRRRRGGPERMDLFKVRGAFSPDGKLISALWWGDKLHVFDAATGQLKHHLGVSRGHTSFSHSPDNRYIALAGLDGAVGLFDASGGRLIKTFNPAPKREAKQREFEDEGFGDQGSLSSIAFAPDSRTLIAGSMVLGPGDLRVGVRYFEVASGQERQYLQTRVDAAGPVVNFELIASLLDAFQASFVFSPDQQFVVEAGFSTLRLRNLRTGKEVRAFSGKQIVGSTAHFSPDGKMLVAGKHDGAIRLWDIATGSVLLDFPAHHGSVTALTFSADGKLLASGGKDASVLIWEWDHIRRQIDVQEPAQAGQLEALWTDLGADNAATAYAAVKALANTPTGAVPFLKGRVRPAPPIDPKLLQTLLDDLEHVLFARRQAAEKALTKLGDLAGPAVRARLAADPPLEMRRRLEELQTKLDAQLVPPEVLQIVRAIEVLEMIATPAARAVLADLAKGAAGHRITEEARQSLERLR
jgi:WD40 repeat protein